MDVNKAFNILLDFEGGLSNSATDLGGLTKYGISQRAFPNVDIKNLTPEGAKQLYVDNYWNVAHCDQLPEALKYVHFDTAVNMGADKAVRILQEAANIAIDGAFGPNTAAKALQVPIADYLFLRECYDAEIVAHRVNQVANLGGWTNRNKKIRILSIAGQLA